MNLFYFILFVLVFYLVIRFTGGTGNIFLFKYPSAIIRLLIGFVFVLIAYFGIKANMGVGVSNIFLTLGYVAVFLIPIGIIQMVGAIFKGNDPKDSWFRF